MEKTVFLSYSTDDSATVINIRDHLEAEGIGCWMAPRDIAPGQDYGAQILDAIEGTTVLLLVLSESSNNSIFVRHEVERAVAKDKVIIPFRIHPIQPSRSLEFFISNYQWVEAWEVPLIQSLGILSHAIHGYLATEPAPFEASAPSSPPISSSPHNLPHQLTPFVGREKELAALDALLKQPDSRLITILGPGGMGKTRLALAAAERHLSDPHFVHGVYFVPLAPLGDVAHIIPMLMDVFSLSSQPDGGTTQQQLLDYLRAKEMLLVFDNFEHLLDGASLVAQILQAAPNVRIIVTSRERLRVPGEHLFPLQGLDYGRPIHNADASESAAAQLFLQSVRQLQSDLVLNEDEMMQVTRICRLVGGMPLGIELAAAWSELLTPAEIAAEIEQSLDFLEAERRGGQEHHRSVRAVFDSTWQRLDHTEQAVFARLSIFRGGFTREVAEHVAGASLRLLSSLAGKALIQHDRQRARYTLHELLRQFAEEKLRAAPESWAEVNNRHCHYFTSFLQRQEVRLKGSEHAAAVSDIEIEIENVRAAWQWAVAHRQIEAVETAMQSLEIFYATKCWNQEGALAFGQAADALEMDAPSGKQGIVLGKLLTMQGGMLAFGQAVDGLETEVPSGKQGIVLGKLLTMQGGMLGVLSTEEGSINARAAALALFERSAAIFQELNAEDESGYTLLHLTTYDLQNKSNESFEEWSSKYYQAISFFAAKNDHYGMSRVYHNLGYHCHELGKYREALDACQRGIALCEERGDLKTLGNTLNIAGETYKALGDYDEAERSVRAALAARTAAGDKRGIAWSLQLLGEVAWYTGDFVSAQKYSEESLALFGEIGLISTQDVPLNVLGHVAYSLGNFELARAYFCTIFEPNLKSGRLDESWPVAEALTGMAAVLAKQGQTERAMELFVHVLHHPTAWYETKQRALKLLTEFTGSAPEFSVEETKGPERPLDVVVADLLQEGFDNMRASTT